MRFICCDLENTSWEDDVDPRHFIMFRQAPPAADPKLARQSLLSLHNIRIHTHTSIQARAHSHAHVVIITRTEVCESARFLSHSLFITFTSLRPSIIHTHTHTKLEMNFDEKHAVWLSASQREVCQQPAISLVGSGIFDKPKIFFSLSLTRKR